MAAWHIIRNNAIHIIIIYSSSCNWNSVFVITIIMYYLFIASTLWTFLTGHYIYNILMKELTVQLPRFILMRMIIGYGKLFLFIVKLNTIHTVTSYVLYIYHNIFIVDVVGIPVVLVSISAGVDFSAYQKQPDRWRIIFVLYSSYYEANVDINAMLFNSRLTWINVPHACYTLLHYYHTSKLFYCI